MLSEGRAGQQRESVQRKTSSYKEKNDNYWEYNRITSNFNFITKSFVKREKPPFRQAEREAFQNPRLNHTKHRWHAASTIYSFSTPSNFTQSKLSKNNT